MPNRKVKHVVIIGAVPVADLSALSAWLKNSDFIIAVDGGIKTLQKLRRAPNWIIGDFDSASKKDISRFSKKCEVFFFPKEKDKSDGELALEHALMRSPSQISFIGALGDRLDHTLCNLALLKNIPKRVEAELIQFDHSKIQRVFLIRKGEEKKISKKEGGTFSLVCFEKKGARLTIEGAKYPLASEVLTPCTRGLSNEIVGSHALIHVEEGEVYCLIDFKE